jgi:hypothetical protein
MAQSGQGGQPPQGGRTMPSGQPAAGQSAAAAGQPGQGGQQQQNQGGQQQGGHNPNIPDIVGFSFKEADTPERQQLLQGLQQLLAATKQHQRPGDSMTVHYSDGSTQDVKFNHNHPQGAMHQRSIAGKQCPYVPVDMGTV